MVEEVVLEIQGQEEDFSQALISSKVTLIGRWGMLPMGKLNESL